MEFIRLSRSLVSGVQDSRIIVVPKLFAADPTLISNGTARDRIYYSIQRGLRFYFEEMNGAE
jgi:hypothetical protein